jgi:hypothetical protein
MLKSVGGAIEAHASRRFIDAWQRAERGEPLDERYLAFESWQALARLHKTDRAVTNYPPAQSRHRQSIGKWPGLQPCSCGCPNLFES